MLEHAGSEATYAFEDVGHSLDARDLLAQYYIGDVHDVSYGVITVCDEFKF